MNIIKYIKDPYYSLGNLLFTYVPKWMPDKYYLKVLWMQRMGYELNLENPSTFNEKIQWLKIHDRNPLYTKLADKIAVKEWVAKKIGNQYVIPTIGVYKDIEDINWETLPDQFVVKCNHDSGSVIICNDKKNFNADLSKKKLEKCLKRNFYWYYREWVYKNIQPQILVEKKIGDIKTLYDYKFLCFNGKVKCSFVCTDRYLDGGLHVTFFDRDWQKLPFERKFKSKDWVEKPKNYELMISLAEKLSRDIPFVRIDFFENSGSIKFGEMTFYPGAGFEEFQPSIWDKKLGELMCL